MEQALAEADVQQGSPPEKAGESSTSTAQETQQTTAAATGAVPAPTATTDTDAQVLARLDKGESVASIRQNSRAVAPSARATQQEAPADGAAEHDGAEAGEGAHNPTDPASTYDGIDAKAESQLRRAGLLENIEPEIWKTMGQKARQGMLATARRILADRGRVGQQLGQARRQAAAAEQTNEYGDLEPEFEEEVEGQTAAGTSADEPRYTAAEWEQVQRGVRAQTQTTTARARPAAGAQQPPAIAEALKPLRETFGDEVAAPLEQMFNTQQQALAQATQVNQTLTAQINALAKAQFEPQEREAFKTLETELGTKIEPAKRQSILNRAFGLMQASSQAGEEITWQQAVEDAGRGVLNPDIRQASQRQLLERSDQRRRATPTKAAGIPRVNRVMSKDDKDAAALAGLEAGRSVAEIRQSLTA